MKDGRYRLYSFEVDGKTGEWRNFNTFETKAAAKKHKQQVASFTGAKS